MLRLPAAVADEVPVDAAFLHDFASCAASADALELTMSELFFEEMAPRPFSLVLR